MTEVFKVGSVTLVEVRTFTNKLTFFHPQHKDFEMMMINDNSAARIQSLKLQTEKKHPSEYDFRDQSIIFSSLAKISKLRTID